MDRHFHPAGIAVTTNETTDDFIFLFKSLKKCSKGYHPKVLISDSAEAITKAFEIVFGNDHNRVN